jgi:hypothetical protein
MERMNRATHASIKVLTSRWTTYDIERSNVTLDPAVPTATQERACTSPTWYRWKP